MTFWTRLQEKFATFRIFSGFFLLVFSIVFLLLLIQYGPTFKIYYIYKTKGIITDFETLKQDGIAAHHLQYADLAGWMRYDVPLDFVTDHNLVQIRMIVLQDTTTQYAVIMRHQPLYGLRDAEFKNVTGMIRKMDDERYGIIKRDIGPFFDDMETAGWTIEPIYYIREGEQLPEFEDIRKILISITIDILLILICLGLFLIPHPRTIKDMSILEKNNPFERKLPQGGDR